MSGKTEDGQGCPGSLRDAEDRRLLRHVLLRVGLRSALNGPWDNTRIRAEVGRVPVVSHGVKGFTINAHILKVF